MLEHRAEVEAGFIVGKDGEPQEGLKLRDGHFAVHLCLDPDGDVGIESLSYSMVGGLQLGHIERIFVDCFQHNRRWLSIGQSVSTTRRHRHLVGEAVEAMRVVVREHLRSLRDVPLL